MRVEIVHDGTAHQAGRSSPTNPEATAKGPSRSRLIAAGPADHSFSVIMITGGELRVREGPPHVLRVETLPPPLLAPSQGALLLVEARSASGPSSGRGAARSTTWSGR